MTMRASNWIGGFRWFVRDPRALLAIGVDATLVGAGLAMAAGAVGFASLMVAEGDHKPDVYGLKYLAIYAQPRKTAKPASEAGRSPEPPARGEIDMSPIGSIGSATPTDAGGYALVSAHPGVAWLRQGSRIIAVRPGDLSPGLGRIVEIAQRDGHWFLIGESGTALLSSEPHVAKDSSARTPFSRRMIFGDDN
jgi:hypothetical protein